MIFIKKNFSSLHVLKILALIFPILFLFLVIYKNNNYNVSLFESQFNYLSQVVDWFYNNKLFSWYFQLMESAFNLSYNGGVSNILSDLLLIYPLYILFINLFDLVLSILLILPKLFKGWLFKWVG